MFEEWQVVQFSIAVPKTQFAVQQQGGMVCQGNVGLVTVGQSVVLQTTAGECKFTTDQVVGTPISQ